MPQDLCGTPVGEKITDLLKNTLAAGNERSAECKYIYIDGNRIKSKHHLKSKHKVRGVTIYDVSYDVEMDEDLTQPNPQDVKICVDVAHVGRLCVSLADIIAVISAAYKGHQA